MRHPPCAPPVPAVTARGEPGRGDGYSPTFLARAGTCENAPVNDEAEIIETVVDDVRVVRVTGEFDADEADAVTAALAAPRDGAALATVVDLGEVTFADSSLLQALLTARQDHATAGLPFVLMAVSPLVRRLLDLTDTARVFTTAPDLTSALDLIREEIISRRG